MLDEIVDIFKVIEGINLHHKAPLISNFFIEAAVDRGTRRGKIDLVGEIVNRINDYGFERVDFIDAC